jgi:hypothetical protein
LRSVVTALSIAWLSLAPSGCTALDGGVPHAGTFDAGPRSDGGRIVIGTGVHGGSTDAGSVEHLQGVDGGWSDATTPPTQCEPVAGAGDVATCPAGDVATFVGGIDAVLCCLCTAADCGNAVCCAESVCAGSPLCAPYHCAPLPASCGGLVDADCDDFPEDCDEPCCPCTMCF